MLKHNYFRSNAATFPYKFHEWGMSYLCDELGVVLLGALDGWH
jgi:hypothetical protein